VTRVFSKWPSKSPGDGGRLRLSRRVFLASFLSSLVKAQSTKVTAEVSAFDLSLLEEGVTHADLFFVREHFPAPAVSSAGWTLSIVGAVSRNLEIAYQDLLSLPRTTLPVTLECAENPVGGGLVSHADWTGFSLASLLERAQPTSEARSVRLSGGDGFSRTIPLTKALHTSALIAHGMNGGRLPENHGFPLRAVIAGWYAMDSIKWLRSIEVLDREAENQSYGRLTRSLLAGTRPDGPVTTMSVKSAFSRPVDGAILTGRRFTIRGAAWAGENRVRQVEVSMDGGKSWLVARLAGEPQPYAWTHWMHEWKIPASGRYELVVRATDDQDRQQPTERPAGRVDDYERNTYQVIQVIVV